MVRFDDEHWDAYNARQGTRPVRDLCRRLLGHAGPGAGRLALDVGAGAGVETAALVSHGWRVLAIDPAPSTVARVTAAVPPGHRHALRVRRVGVGAALPLPGLDLVHASFALPFVPPEEFPDVWHGLRSALRPGGWCGVTFFGPRDQWACAPGLADRLTFHDRAAVDEVFAGWETVEVTEHESDGTSFGGPKHWHTIEVVARRPASGQTSTGTR
ncbi:MULTISPECIES: class I SAM-dependent methyltransferase [unclassified Isoptericola]|uniref:class I SAM-dependent methyltransferase n=1 Tax=unclassified Isoptericola TaxID=2623355 RepID=UPI0027143CF7|nr:MULTISPECIES: class I SAM-dependent methyltransferase [unclassified Isoptericola]MDO8144862.1 class I SAM-dependent methyltransferase [Isoptericola sp. 178]MDO8149642.1 class I SAM-dependent methyltransferase [Isoptericola sp. b515]MDO8152576.1 class I SAM-dependent methyltransferase [Isoptericola sp. b408]